MLHYLATFVLLAVIAVAMAMAPSEVSEFTSVIMTLTAWSVIITTVMMVRVVKVKAKRAGVSTQCWIARRRIVRDIRRGRESRPVELLHLTEEQWQSHAGAFADYCAGMGKYHRGSWSSERGWDAWLENEGLPPTHITEPLVRLMDSSWNTTGWLYMDASAGEVEIYNDLGYVQSVTFYKS